MRAGRGRLKVLALAVLAALGSGVPVGVQAAPEEDIYFSELPIVGSVSRLPQRLADAPGAVTVIDRAMIRASGARDFVDLLRFVPGFQVVSHNQEGGIVAYHGLSNEEYTPRVQVLIDGVSQYSPLFKSGVNWNLLPVALDNIDRIEVMRGANSISYGSNALLGVINIITLDASQTHGWMMSANRGNNAINDQTLRWGGRVGEADVRATIRQNGDAGFQKMFDGSLGWFDPHDTRHGNLIDLRADMMLSNRDELRLGLSHIEDVSQFGRPKSLGDPFRDLQQHSTSATLEWTRVLSPDEEFKLRYAHVDDWAAGPYREQVSYRTVERKNVSYFTERQIGGRSARDDFELLHRFAPSASTRMAWGGGYRAEHEQSVDQFSTANWRSRNTWRTFANLEWTPHRQWLFNFGGSLESDSIAGTYFDPRVSARYRLAPDHTVRLIVSQAHRNPSLYEANGEQRKAPPGLNTPVNITYLAYPGLQAERIQTIEAGYLGEWKQLQASLDVRVFRESIPNRIVQVPIALPAESPDSPDAPDIRRLRKAPYGMADASLNLENVEIQGYEYQLRWQPLNSTRVLYNHALIHIDANHNPTQHALLTADLTYINRISAQTMTSAPLNSQSAMLVQQLPGQVEASAMYYKQGMMRWSRNSYINPSERVDWRLAKTFQWGSNKAEIAYVAQMANHHMEGRRFTRVAKEMHWVSLRLEF